MNSTSDKAISLIEAARLMFRTQSPSEAQISHLQKIMKAGLIAGCHCQGPPLQWTTTAAAVADYLAKKSLQKQTTQHAAATGVSPAPSLFRENASKSGDEIALHSLYQGVWRDYFLSVFLRRKAAHQTIAFQRAVLAGQVCLLLLLVGLMFGGVRLTMKPVPPEHAVVEKFLENNTEYYSVLRWHPVQPAPAGQGVLLRVEYLYRADSSRPIQTDRVFLVQGDQVQEVLSDD